LFITVLQRPIIAFDVIPSPPESGNHNMPMILVVLKESVMKEVTIFQGYNLTAKESVSFLSFNSAVFTQEDSYTFDKKKKFLILTWNCLKWLNSLV
jgi:hypothetical protein